MEWNWILEEYDDMVYVSDLNNYELLYVNRAGLDMFHLSGENVSPERSEGTVGRTGIQNRVRF